MQNLPIDTIGSTLFQRDNFRMLLEQRDKDGCYPIHYASREGQVNVLATLIRHGAEINKKTNQRQSSLHFAAQYVIITIHYFEDVHFSSRLDMVDTTPVDSCWTHQASSALSMNLINQVEHRYISVVKMDILELFNYFCIKVRSSLKAMMEIHHYTKQRPMDTSQLFIPSSRLIVISSMLSIVWE